MSQEGETSIKVAFKTVTALTFLSGTAIPVCQYLSNIQEAHDNPHWLLSIIALICITQVIATYFLLLRKTTRELKTSVFFYVFSLFAFTAVVDILIALTLNGYIDTLQFWFKAAEPQLQSSYGMLQKYWEGSVHYLLYIFMTVQIAQGKSIRYVGLFWVGSALNGILVLLSGSMVGKYGDKLQPMFLANLPYIIMPIAFAYKILKTTSPAKQAQREFEKLALENKQNKFIDCGFFVKMLDYIYIFFSLGMSFLLLVRFFSALGSPYPMAQKWIEIEPIIRDPNMFGVTQAVLYAAYAVPYFLATAVSLFWHGKGFHWLPDWSSIMAGAFAQGQFCLIGQSLINLQNYPEESFTKPIKIEAFWEFNIEILALVLLLCFRSCYLQLPEHFITDDKSSFEFYPEEINKKKKNK